jgi:tight adherence protein B
VTVASLPVAPPLAFAAAALAVLAGLTLWPEVARGVGDRAPRAVAQLVESVAGPLRAGRAGRAPGLAERRRLVVAVAVAGLACGWLIGGPVLALAGASLAPAAAARAVRASRERYRRAVDAGAASIATALADALTGGHSVRGAIAEAAGGLTGAAGAELRRTAGELALGAGTEEALDAMRARSRSHGIDTVVAACLLQRSAGGDLARLLRDCARALEDHARLQHDARAATAQARFTGLIVVLMPLGGALLAELASPGYLASLSHSFLTAWLAGIALVMQAVAAVLIRRLGRVRL